MARPPLRARLVQLAVILLSRLPLRVGHGLGVLVGLTLFLFPTRMRRVTDVNLALCYPNRDARWRKRIARISLIETGKSLVEAPYLWRQPADRIAALVKLTTGGSIIRDALAQGRGIILAAPHLGSWELCGLVSAMHGAITSLYRPPRLDPLEAILRAGRENTGAHLVPTDAHGIKMLIQALNRKQSVGILPDQVPNAGNGVYAPFFGIGAYTMVLITRLARRRRTPVVFVYAKRLPGGAGYHVHYRAAHIKLYDMDLKVAADALNQSVEEMVRECPGQYTWSYKRFKHRPPGEPPFYR